MFLLSVDTRTKEHKIYFYQTFHFHIPFCPYVLLSKKTVLDGHVFIIFRQKNIRT